MGMAMALQVLLLVAATTTGNDIGEDIPHKNTFYRRTHNGCNYYWQFPATHGYITTRSFLLLVASTTTGIVLLI